jgi:hypothetical protein
MAGVTHDADLAVTGKVSQTGTPSAAADLITKSFLDASVFGLKNVIVRAAATANVTLASAVENGDTLDGVTLATGDLILLPSQTTAAERGIYVVNASGAPTRHGEFDATGDLVAGTVVRVRQGTANIGSTWLVTALGATPWVPGTSSSTWVKVRGILPAYEQGGSVVVAVTDGGTGRNTSTSAYGVLAAGTTATGAHQTIAPSATSTHALFSTSTSALPTFRAIAESDVVNLVTDLAAKQPLDADLTALATAFITASSAGPASLDFAEDTDNGANRIRLSAPASIASDVTVTLPGVASTLATIGGTETLTAKTLTSPVINTPTGIVKGDVGLGNVDNTSDTNKPVSTAQATADNLRVEKATFPVHIAVAISDLTTDLTTGTGKEVLHLPYAMTLTSVFAEVATVSSSGLVTVDINEGAGSGTTVLSTKLSIDASEEVSSTAATAAVISDSALAAGARLTFDIDAAGTGARGLKVHLIGTRAV